MNRGACDNGWNKNFSSGKATYTVGVNWDWENVLETRANLVTKASPHPPFQT
jgi:hypothetical protein